METSAAITRESLYEEVWTEPVSRVAPRYGISDVALGKVCRKYRIPLPPRGYWAKINAGKSPRKLPLPIAREFVSCSLPLSRSPTYDPNNPDASRKKAITAQERIGLIAVPEELESPHRLIQAASKRLKRKAGWDNYKGLRSASAEIFDFEVTHGAINRALLVGDTLIKALERQGIKVWVDPEKSRTLIGIGDTSLPIAISEHVARTKHKVTAAEQKAIERWRRSPNRWGAGYHYPSPPDYDYHPTGKLTISIGIYPSRSWSDTPKTSLEQRLHQVVAGALDLIEEERIRTEEQERRRLAWQKAKDRYDRQVELRKQELAQLEKLKASAAQWLEAERLRQYIDAVEQSAVSDGRTSEELADWIAWARIKADCIDPLVAVSDAILDSPEPRSPGYCY
ncbi:hypothetical protein FE848_05080 [Marinobacter sp. 1-3A]|uniref:hypothetical protein n=1 Tax=Marinobacter sp. 1-3A TaxID=2582920 RepID=UPI0019039EF7|nr:hypothetical protein [Marinobacter sp. 1-3A]MBK1872589.1 hypothetical protein [Marinobacter sp. 1-3A]